MRERGFDVAHDRRAVELVARGAEPRSRRSLREELPPRREVEQLDVPLVILSEARRGRLSRPSRPSSRLGCGIVRSSRPMRSRGDAIDVLARADATLQRRRSRPTPAREPPTALGRSVDRRVREQRPRWLGINALIDRAALEGRASSSKAPHVVARVLRTWRRSRAGSSPCRRDLVDDEERHHSPLWCAGDAIASRRRSATRTASRTSVACSVL